MLVAPKYSAILNFSFTYFCRCLSVGNVQNSNSEGWFSKLLMVRKIDPGHDSHSRLLSASEMIYEMQSKYLIFNILK